MPPQARAGTLIEILVVMLILALLAAIAIPSFFSQKDEAIDADAKASVRVAQTSAETLASEYAGPETPSTSARTPTARWTPRS